MVRPAHLLAALVVALAPGCGGGGDGPTPGVADHCYPDMFDTQPKGNLPAGTTVVVLRMKTDRNAICRQSPLEGLRFSDMQDTFETTGGVEHTTSITGLGPRAYRWFAKCEAQVNIPVDCSTPHDLIFLFQIDSP
jgi:hypothetical protein